MHLEYYEHSEMSGPFWWFDHAVFLKQREFHEELNIAVFSRDGTLAFKSMLTAPKLEELWVKDAAPTKSGGVVASVQFKQTDGNRGSYIAELDARGRLQHQITTDPFIPELLCPADDGSVWAFGYDCPVTKPGENAPRSCRAEIRHYSFTKGLAVEVGLSEYLLFGHNVFKGTGVACSEHRAWVYYGERSHFLSYDEQANALHSYQVIMPPEAGPEVGVHGFTRTASRDFYGSLNSFG